MIRADGTPILRDAHKHLALENVRIRSGRVDASRIRIRLPDLELLRPLREEQQSLASEIVEQDEPAPIRVVAGVDVAYQGDQMVATAVSVPVEGLETTELAVVRRPVTFPYIPTYLAYREFPGIEAAVRRLSRRPDVLMIDGHGRLHPALFGVACYAGLKLDLPTIGIAKHPLAGRVKSSNKRHLYALPIEIDGITRGYAWTPPGRARAIYVSVGHRISLESALAVVQKTTRHGYPEALKIADRISSKMKWNEKREKGAAR